MPSKKCGNCNYCEFSKGDLICTNDNSEYVADFVEKNHTCDEWEKKDNE